ncbi:uncharacterized protein [Drosophila takahashii]|uniref:uncharacterized protein n=1 Tax=Drosophila takahashii TaxID=29030 RepID=UPI003899210A
MSPQAVKTQLGFCKSQITRAHGRASEFISTVTALEHHLRRIMDTFDQLLKLSAETYSLSEGEDLAEPDDLLGDETKYYELHALLSDAIAERKRTNPHSSTLIANGEDPLKRLATSQAQLVASQTQGNYEDWPQFCDLFLGSVDRRENLTSCQKFHYLKSYLDGDALNLVKHIAVTEENYAEAWDKLVHRYDKKALITRSFIAGFLSLPNVAASGVAALRKLADTADESIRGLHALGCDQRDPWLIHILLGKLDMDTRQSWAERQEGCSNDVKIGTFLEFLFSRCDALESCQSTPKAYGRRTANVHIAGEASKPSQKLCIVCTQPNSIMACTQFLSMEIPDRRSFVKLHKLCFNCLSRNHVARQCTSKFRCRLCKGSHHTLVHQESQGEREPPAANSSDSSGTRTEALPAGISNFSVETAFLARAQTMMPTILAYVVDRCGTRTLCRILLDSGSTITLATEAFIQRIGAPRTHARISVMGLSAQAAGSGDLQQVTEKPEQAHHAQVDLDEAVRAFMEMDTIQPSQATIDACDPVEQLFVDTHKRDQDGVYIVEYPFKKDMPTIQDPSLRQALNRFAMLEIKFRRNPALKNQYCEFMKDYLQRGHMEMLDKPQLNVPEKNCFYLAHHAVLKAESSTTKCRVVFDGSGKDITGHSLNDRLHIGPPIQRDLFGVCLRFRQYRYVVCTDIEKMFRGIKIAPEHSDYQRIVWRKEEKGPASALSAANCNLRASTITFSGSADTEDGLIKLQKELVGLLAEAKFNLRKWSSNSKTLMDSLPKEDCAFQAGTTQSNNVKILGLLWNPDTDTFSTSPRSIIVTQLPTKRTLL